MNRKISEMTTATSLADADLLTIVQGGVNKQIEADTVREYTTTYYETTSAETTAGVTPSDKTYEPGDIRRYGATTAAADNSTAINNAILVNAAGGNEVFITGGSWTCTSNINILSNTLIRGSGEESHLIMSGCKIHADGPTVGAFITGWTLEKFQCSRTGSAGEVIHLQGGQSSDDPIRFCIDDVYISGSTGTGLRMQSTYIGDIVSPLIRGCVTGVVLENATNVAANAISFFGGEIQNNTTGMTMNDCNGIQFFGTVIEGNSGGGLDIRRRCAATGLYNCWFEGNGSFDIRVGNDATSPRQSQVLNIQGGLISDGTAGKDHGIILESVTGLNIEGVYHTGYSVSLVGNDQVSAGAVRGVIKNVYSADSIANLDTPNIYIYEQQSAGETAYTLRTGAGAVALTSPAALITTTGTDALTLADGYEGQRIRLTMIGDGGVGTLTPSNLAGGSTITFDDIGDSADLHFLSGNWHKFGGSAQIDQQDTYEVVTATNVITAAENGKTFYLDAAGGFTSTLPAPVAGLKYTFIVKTAPTTAYIVTTNSGDNVLYGTYLDIVGELTYFSAQDTLNFVASTSVVGDRLEVESDGTNWYCKAFSGADGGITVSVT